MSDDTTRMPPDLFPSGGNVRKTAGEPTTPFAGEPTRTHAGASVPPASREPDHPAWLGPYEILGVLGMGGMGIVYKARQERPSRLVALKVIRSGFHDAKLLRRFEMEGEAHGRLHHPGIAQIYEVGQIDTPHGEQPFFAMEYIQGRPITTWARERDLDARARLALVASVCDAVQHAHQRGVIHRDLKPDNILVDESGQVKILDFGLARVTAPDLQLSTQLSMDGMVMGTLPYMAPEQASGRVEEIDTRCDIYALGVIAYELLSGRKPLDLKGRVITEAFRIIRESEPPRLSAILPLLRGDVDTIVAKALEKDKERRYASASELASDIRLHLADQPIGARPPSRLYVLGKFARRHKAVVGGAAAVLLALLAGVTGTSLGLLRARTAEGLAEQRRQTAEQALLREKEARARLEEQTRQTTLNYGLALKESADAYFARGEFNPGKVMLARAAEILPEEYQTEMRLKNALLPELSLRPGSNWRLPHGRNTFRCLSGDGRFAFLWESSRAVRHDLLTDTRTVLEELGPHAVPQACSFDGKFLFVAEQGKPSHGHLWDLGGTPRRVGSLEADPASASWSHSTKDLAAFSPDGRHLATWSCRRASLGLVVHRTEDFSVQASLPYPANEQPELNQIYSALCYSADGRFLAVARDQGVLKLSSHTLQRVAWFATQEGATAVPSGCADVAISADGRFIAILFGTTPSRVQLHDSDRFLHWDTLLPGVAYELGFVAEDRLLAFGGQDRFGLLNATSGELLAQLPLPGAFGEARQPPFLAAGGVRLDTTALAGFNTPPDKGYQGELPKQLPLALDLLPPGLATRLSSPPPDRRLGELVMSEADGRGRRACAGWDRDVHLFTSPTGEVRQFSTRLHRARWLRLVEDGKALLVLGMAGEFGEGPLGVERLNLDSGVSRVFTFPKSTNAHQPVVTRDERVVFIVDTAKQVWGGDARAPETITKLLPAKMAREEVRPDPAEGGDVRFRIPRFRYDTHRLGGVLDRPLPPYTEQVKRLGYRLQGIQPVWTNFEP